jgi:hypothetical protein
VEETNVVLVIRREQLAAFDAYAAQSFEDRTYAHLLRYFPRHCQLLGQRQMRLVIQHGWAKARRHDLVAECCVRTIIELMCVLGSGFDADPMLPWVDDVLANRSPGDDVVRGDRLYESAWRYVDAIVPDYRDEQGQPSTARFVGELHQLRQLPSVSVAPAADPALLQSMCARIQRVFPAKCAFVGPELVPRAIALGIQAAGGHGITSERGLTSFVGMRFVLGAAFDRDLLLPWASDALRDDPAVPDPNDRADRLFAAGVSFLRRWWDSAPERRA